MTGHVVPTRGAGPGRLLGSLLWCVQALLALEFAMAGWAKLTGNPDTVALFTAIGVGQWFRYVTGSLELCGALLIVVPRTARIGATVLGIVMLGAVGAHLFILDVSPLLPGVLLLLCGLVVWGRRVRPLEGRALSRARVSGSLGLSQRSDESYRGAVQGSRDGVR